jgi:hypothetical protein
MLYDVASNAATTVGGIACAPLRREPAIFAKRSQWMPSFKPLA